MIQVLIHNQIRKKTAFGQFKIEKKKNKWQIFTRNVIFFSFKHKKKTNYITLIFYFVIKHNMNQIYKGIFKRNSLKKNIEK